MVYIDVDNRERAKPRDKKQKKHMKLLKWWWENEKC